jgi:hypothetical protein
MVTGFPGVFQEVAPFGYSSLGESKPPKKP